MTPETAVAHLVEIVAARADLSEDDVYAGLLKGQAYLHSLGITAWQDAIVESAGWMDNFDAYLTAAARGGLTARVVEQSASGVRIVIGPTDVPQGGSPDAPSFCAQVITPRVLTVELKAPLGNRKVIVAEASA